MRPGGGAPQPGESHLLLLSISDLFCGFQRVPLPSLIIPYFTRKGWIGLGLGACHSRAREGKGNQVGVRVGAGAGTSPPSLFPGRYHGFSLRLALGTMGREASRALKLHVKGVIMEGMWHTPLAQRTAWGAEGLFHVYQGSLIFSAWTSFSISTHKSLNE